MGKIYIVGVGMTAFKRHLDRSVKDLVSEAVTSAISDAGLHMDHVDCAFFGSCAQGLLQGQHLISGQVALMPLGLQGRPIFNVENACATGSTCLHLASTYLHAGSAKVALAVGVDKLYTPDRQKRFAIFDGAWDVEAAETTHRHFRDLAADLAPRPNSGTKTFSPFMDVYAGFARQYMRRYGITQRQLAIIAAKNRRHARENELAQFRESLDVDEVLAAPIITYPLTLPMCSPISDGAAAALLCTEDALSDLGIDKTRAITIEASVFRSARTRDADDLEGHLSRLAAQKAYHVAGLQPSDMNVAEVHDATAMGELMQAENLGFCEPGEGGALAEAGETSLGGRIPINPSGGLEAKGHPIGATGLGQVFELVSQLRGECGSRQVEGARYAIQENGGGIWGVEESTCHIGIYGRA